MATFLPAVQLLRGTTQRDILGIIVVAAAAGVALSMFSADIALGGGILERIAVPTRMLALVALATMLLTASGETWCDVGLRTPLSLRRSATLLVVGYLAVAAAFVIISQFLLPALGIAQETSKIFSELRGDFGEYLYWLFPIAWGSAAFGEELVFRGYVQTRLERVLGSTRAAPLLAALGQAVIFGSLHAYLGLGGATLAATTGLVIGIVYFAGGRNLWPCIILHGLIDTVSLTAMYMGAAN